MLNRTTPDPLLTVEYIMEPEDGELHFSQNIELVFYEPPPNKGSFSKRLGTLPGSPYILENRTMARSPVVNFTSRRNNFTSPRSFYPDEWMLNSPYSNNRRSIAGGTPMSWGTDSDNDTVERESEESGIMTPSVIFTPNRYGKKYQPINPRRIYLENLEPIQPIIKRSRGISKIEERWMRQRLVADESTSDHSSQIHFQSSGSSDLKPVSNSNNYSLYSTESMADKECGWATFVPVTPESGNCSNESSTVESSSEMPNLELKMNSHCQDELKINESGILSIDPEIAMKEVTSIQLII